MKLLENHTPDFLRFYIPRNVPDSILDDQYKKKSKLTYIIHLINNLWHRRDGDWVPLYSGYLKDVVGNSYRKYLDYLDEKGVIDRSDSYSSDRGQCKKYRLTSRYRGISAREVTCRDKPLIRRLSKKQKQENRLFYRKQPYIHLRESLQATTIDTLSAKKYLYQEMDGLVQAQVNTFRKSIEKIGEGFSTYSKTGKNGRIDTPIANLPSELRDFLILDGSRDLVELDITNSQPFFMALRYKEHLTRNYFSEPPLRPRARDVQVRNHKNNSLETSFLVSPESPNLNVSYPGTEFIRDAKNGVLYERIAEESPRNLTREEAKDLIWPVLYSHPSSHLDKKKEFGNLYPNVMNWVVHQKKPHYRDFPIRMQRMESSLIIEDLCKRLQEEGIKVLTIHDAIVVKEEKKQPTERIWRSAFRENHGIVPEYTVERLSSEIEVEDPS